MLLEEKNSFCCSGCRAVFNILIAKNQLQGFEGHPVFLQAVQAGLISNPKLLEQLQQKKTILHEQREKLYLEILGLWCPSCGEIIRLILLQKEGITHVAVDYSTDLALIEFCPLSLGKDQIIQSIQSLGYDPRPLDQSGESKVAKPLTLRFILATFFSLNIMMLSYPLYATYFDPIGTSWGTLFAWISAIASLPVVTYCAWPIWKRLIHATQVGLMGMELLVFLGCFSALALSFWNLAHGSAVVYFDSMTVIITFILLGKMIETKGKFSAKQAVSLLARSLPKRGKKRFEGGREEYVPIKEFSVGDLCIVSTGEKIVLDGKILQGEGAVDESMLTGEALPQVKKSGDLLIGGTIVQTGSFLFQVSATMEKTALHRILETVEQQLQDKTPYVRAADSIVTWFIPIVLLLALGTVLFGSGPLAAISVLLISCPCALGIAAPLAESKTLSSLASIGAIVRNRGVLRLLGKETVVLFDKTGTLTFGKFQTERGLEALSDDQLCRIKGLASRSNHPISLALLQAISMSPHPYKKVIECPGLGMIGDDCDLLGSKKLMLERGIQPPECSSHSTVVYFYDGTCHPIFFSDTLRPDAKETVLSLFPAKPYLLSGDGEGVVAACASACGIEKFLFGMSPLQKRDKIEELKKKGEIVLMVGDGINDAPALAQAHIGASVVNAQDLSIQASDLFLTSDRLTVLPKIVKVAKKGRKIVRQNLFWAFFYNALGIPLAMSGSLSPIYSAASMVASSLIVILNARRVK
jgi:Cu2+-exporting ATPase